MIGIRKQRKSDIEDNDFNNSMINKDSKNCLANGNSVGFNST